MLVSASSVLAQSRGVKTDAISGTWTGELIVNRSRPITLQLKFDGTRKVTGTLTGLPNPADVKAGTFDPKTGALKLELGMQGDPAVLLVFAGKVVDGKAAGTVTGEDTGEFKIAKK
ncbi:MAG TPA: hypothetical protein VKH34_16260 [Vicinamibacterales bacterium]|nr:hypothetical protein [Vicinamibacterales bacterium]